MSPNDERIAPVMTPAAAPYWEGCRNGELRLQHCADCGHYQLFPRDRCTRCRGSRVAWRTVSGHGQVESFTRVHVPLTPAWAAETPYIVALIRLAEGPLMMSNLHHCTPDELRVGLPVEVLFERRSDSVTLPQFQPRAVDGAVRQPPATETPP